jgi:hypothetical protein
LKFLEEGVEGNGQENGPKDRCQKGREDLIEEIKREKGEKKDGNEKDMLSFHIHLKQACPVKARKSPVSLSGLSPDRLKGGLKG